MEAGGYSGGGGYTPSTPTVTPDQDCEHDFSKVAHDDNIHWSVCTKCNSTMENSEDPHTFGEAIDDGGTTGTHTAICTFEGCEYKQTSAHEFDENGNCTECDAIRDATQIAECEHDFSETGNDDTYHWTKCSKCGEIQEDTKQEHTLGEYENNYDGTHGAKCTKEGCEYESTLAHTFGENGSCLECNAEACEEGEHSFTQYKWNDEQHWLACKWCNGAKRDTIKDHTFGEWVTTETGEQKAECTDENCQYYKLQKVEAKEADLNGDKQIDVTDLIILKRHVIAGNKTEWILTGDKLKLADINKDGNVDITDILILKRTILESL